VIDLHTHSTYSDGSDTPSVLARRAREAGLHAIALTDHNSLSNAIPLQRLAPFPVIVGEEIKTTEGEIIGLFLTDEIPRGMSPEATVEAIHQQGGVVYIPHPFDRVRRSVLRTEALMEILDQVDVIETYNSRISFPGDVLTAIRFAEKHGKLKGAGSDSHVFWELGNSFVEMPEFTERDGFLQSLAQGSIHGKLTHPVAHLASTITKWRKKYMKR
jgi:predicted metal-dependent phosphoesterase TrpH